MAEEADRTLARQRVFCPTDNSLFVDIPVINSSGFRCMAEQAQEYRWTIKNNLTNTARVVHTHRVTNPQDSSQYVDVERIDKVIGNIAANQAQEYVWNFKNQDPPPRPPVLIEGDPQHERVHYVRYCKDNDPDSDVWIDVELIDQVKIKCMAEQAQEYLFYLKHPPIDQDTALGSVVPDVYNPTFAQCDLGLPLVADGQAPWRFDPFQNPVNVNWQPPTHHYHYGFQLVIICVGLNVTAPYNWYAYQWLQFGPYTYHFTLPDFQPMISYGSGSMDWDTYFTSLGFSPWAFNQSIDEICPTPIAWEDLLGLPKTFDPAVLQARPYFTIDLIGHFPSPIPHCYA